MNEDAIKTNNKQEGIKNDPPGRERRWNLAGAECGGSLEYLKEDRCLNFGRGESSSKLLLVPASEVEV